MQASILITFIALSGYFLAVFVPTMFALRRIFKTLHTAINWKRLQLSWLIGFLAWIVLLQPVINIVAQFIIGSVMQTIAAIPIIGSIVSYLLLIWGIAVIATGILGAPLLLGIPVMIIIMGYYFSPYGQEPFQRYIPPNE